ncbi:MAG TPA: hypothetical protein VGY55_01695 [Pirellulales bacterium]|jgi:hypothetical protein|nr:hypothetical protein [Pirellulales bacterium]
MKPTSEDLYGALHQIGMDERDEPIRREILDRLAEWKIVEIQPDGRPTLTKYGQRCFTGLESGDWGTPEFDE